MGLLLAFLVTPSLLTGCDFPFSSQGYTVRSEEAAQLLQIYAEGSEDCTTCMSESCGDSAEDCAQTESCAEVIDCIRQRANPAADAHCFDAYGAEIETQKAAERLSQCWTGCFSRCDVGEDFQCMVDGYTAHRPADTSIVLTQRLGLVLPADPLEGAQVKICDALTDCSSPLASAVTDSQGVYSAEVDIHNDKPSLYGFRGYRLIDHPLTGSAKLESNLPIWSDRYDETLLVSKELFETMGRMPNGTIFAQIFDCKSSGVGGAVFEVEDYDEAHYWYWIGNPTKSGDRTTLEYEGSGFIYDLEVNRGYTIVAKRKVGGEELARGSVFLSEDQPVYLSLYPTPRDPAK